MSTRNKMLKRRLSFKDFEKMGFVDTEAFGIKGYNGVCIASKHPINSIEKTYFLQ